MRKEPYTIGSYVHVFNRGHNKAPIVKDAEDEWRFLKLLRYLNHSKSTNNWSRDVHFYTTKPFEWPNMWPKQQPLVIILGYCLMQNHFHLLLKEIKENGVSLFMQKLGTAMSNFHNTKYQCTGSLFQGSYKAKTIPNDMYLKYVAYYIMVKNPFDRYPGVITDETKSFNMAYEWAKSYPFSSLGVYTGDKNFSIVSKEILGELFLNPQDFKQFSEDCFMGKAIGVEV